MAVQVEDGQAKNESEEAITMAAAAYLEDAFKDKPDKLDIPPFISRGKPLPARLRSR